MRIRITHATTGQLDGLDLSRLEVAKSYDVGASLAAFLLEGGNASLVADDWPALLVPVPSTHEEPADPAKVGPKLKGPKASSDAEN